jgi:hypothetical protein
MYNYIIILKMPYFTNKNANLVSILLIAISLIMLGGGLFYLNDATPINKKNPMFWAFSFGFASSGVGIILSLIVKNLLPSDAIYKINSLTTL